MHNGDDDAYAECNLIATLYHFSSGSCGAKCKTRAQTGEEVTPAKSSKGANVSSILPHIANFYNGYKNKGARFRCARIFIR